MCAACGESSTSLFGVRETAQVIIADAVDRTRADAGAAHGARRRRRMARSGRHRVCARWSTATSSTRESWVVSEVATAHQGVIVEDSDIARDQLQGAPLASWRHLIVAPVPAGRGRAHPRAEGRPAVRRERPDSPGSTRARRRGRCWPPRSTRGAWRASSRSSGTRPTCRADRYSTNTRSSTSCSATALPSVSNRPCSNRFRNSRSILSRPERFFSMVTTAQFRNRSALPTS